MGFYDNSTLGTNCFVCFFFFLKILIKLSEHCNNDWACFSVTCLLIWGLTIKNLLNWTELLVANKHQQKNIFLVFRSLIKTQGWSYWLFRELLMNVQWALVVTGAVVANHWSSLSWMLLLKTLIWQKFWSNLNQLDKYSTVKYLNLACK